MKKRILAVLSTAILAVGGAIALPTMASAHTGDLLVTSVCNTETGQYDLTATLTTSNSGLDANTMWRIGTPQFQGTPNSAAGMDQGPISTHGAQTVTLGTFSLPGNTTGYGPWVYAFTKWSNNYKVGSDGQLTTPLKGDCVKPEPPFPGVEKYTPSYGSTCEAATYSHPEIKTGFGIANVYGVRWGATQAEAQAKPFEAYTPNTVVTFPFADPYIGNGFYFELKVGYDGQNLTHQIGQTRGVSTACEKPVPPKPEIIVGDEQRVSDPVCVIPLDGTETSTIETRIWTQDWIWNAETWVWDADKRVYDEWEIAETVIADNEDCEPEEEIEEETPIVPVVKTEDPAPALAVTGDSGTPLWMMGGFLALMLGVGVLVASSLRKKNS